MMTGMQGDGLNPRTYSKAEYDTLRTANQRLEGEVAKYRELLAAWRRMFDGGIASGELGVLRGQTDAALRGNGGE